MSKKSKNKLKVEEQIVSMQEVSEKNRSMIKVAIAYDFDGTLAKGNIQENSFLPKLDISKEEFWQEVKKQAQIKDMNEILSYMFLLIQKADARNMTITREELKKHGENVEFFVGVEEYFDVINKYAKEQGVELEHYIISSGTKEMIEGTSIARHFRAIFASSFVFDNYGKPVWPATAIDYTSKTQYLYRISKGVLNTWDSAKINKKIPDNERSVHFENMIYVGDGETDIPAMAVLKARKGISIVVYDEDNKKKIEQAQEILENNKADYAVPANYSQEGKLVKAIKHAISRMVCNKEYGKRQWDNETQNFATENQILDSKKDLNNPLTILGVDTIAITTANTNEDEKNYILLEKYEWNDYGYETLFNIHRKRKNLEDEFLGQVKIAKKGQKKGEHTECLLDPSFKQLGEDFFSCVKIQNRDINDDEKRALRDILNDISEESQFDDEDIVRLSLKRSMLWSWS